MPEIKEDKQRIIFMGRELQNAQVRGWDALVCHVWLLRVLCRSMLRTRCWHLVLFSAVQVVI
jgi:hypothetical protein